MRVRYHYGFSARLGGGAYPRQAGFSSGPVVRVPDEHATLQAAIDAAEQLLQDETVTGAVVEITDSSVYAESLRIDVAAGKWVELRAAETRRPVLALGDDLVLTGGSGAEVRLDGLLIVGAALSVPESANGGSNALGRLTIAHCTLAPVANAFDSGPAPITRLRVATRCEVQMKRCISGALRLSETSGLTLFDSVVDAGDPEALLIAEDADEPAGTLNTGNVRSEHTLKLHDSTLVGRIHALSMEADNVMFHAAAAAAPVRIERVQKGCLRFSWVPPGSITPRCYRCQPPDEQAGPRPVFTSLTWGDAGYAQLGARCPVEIREGAEDGGEMGAFRHLLQTQKSARLRRNLPEYLRLSLEAGLFFES